MKNNLIILMLISLFVIALEPQWILLISCLVLTILLLSLGGGNE